MRLRAFVFAGACAAAVVAGAWELAGAAVERIERETLDGLATAFQEAGEGWAEVRADGLQVWLAGTAPDEASRFRVVEIAHGLVDAARLHESIRVASAHPGTAPDFAVEILRNDEAVSLIGIVPAEGARGAIRAGLVRAGLGGAISDMLETAAYPPPESWRPALDFGLSVLAQLPRAKVRVAPGTVAVSAVTATEEERLALADRLQSARPPDVALTLDLSAPRPVIAPFAVSFRRDASGAGRLLACSAETREGAAAIVAAAREAGLEGEAECRLGLGAPSPDWAEAAAAGIAAVAEMGGGSFSLRDLEAVLAGPPDFDPAHLAEIGAGLDAALPPIFALATRGAALAGDAEGGGVVYAPEFRARLLEDRTVRLAGPLADRTAQLAVLGFAEAVFGHDKVINTTVLDPNLPEGWPGRVLAGIEALALLNEGALAITPEAVSVSGTSLIEDAESEIEAFFAEKGSPPPALDVAFDPEALAAVQASAALVRNAAPDAAKDGRVAAADEAADAPELDGTTCVEAIADILAGESIVFESGSATIAEDSRALMATIAEALGGCPGTAFEVAGHTDSSGGADANQRLSEDRAAAVLAALEEAGLDGSVDLVAVGYGEDQPVADNGTEEGRSRNRRIEFALLPAQEDVAEGGAANGTDDVAE